MVVFDELERSQSHILVDQMARYFRDTQARINNGLIEERARKIGEALKQNDSSIRRAKETPK